MKIDLVVVSHPEDTRSPKGRYIFKAPANSKLQKDDYVVSECNGREVLGKVISVLENVDEESNIDFIRSVSNDRIHDIKQLSYKLNKVPFGCGIKETASKTIKDVVWNTVPAPNYVSMSNPIPIPAPVSAEAPNHALMERMDNLLNKIKSGKQYYYIGIEDDRFIVSEGLYDCHSAQDFNRIFNNNAFTTFKEAADILTVLQETVPVTENTNVNVEVHDIMDKIYR